MKKIIAGLAAAGLFAMGCASNNASERAATATYEDKAAEARQDAPTVYDTTPHGDSATEAQVTVEDEVWDTDGEPRGDEPVYPDMDEEETGIGGSGTDEAAIPAEDEAAQDDTLIYEYGTSHPSDAAAEEDEGIGGAGPAEPDTEAIAPPAGSGDWAPAEPDDGTGGAGFEDEEETHLEPRDPADDPALGEPDEDLMMDNGTGGAGFEEEPILETDEELDAWDDPSLDPEVDDPSMR